jgi:hypothetical protein
MPSDIPSAAVEGGADVIIRKEQLDVLSQYMLSGFHQRMERHLRAEYPDQTKGMSDEKLHDLVVTGSERATGYGITDTNDVRRFLEYVAVYGVDFGKTPNSLWAEPFLLSKGLTGTAKMNEIDAHKLFVLSRGQ